jgi:hypothetical protein
LAKSHGATINRPKSVAILFAAALDRSFLYPAPPKKRDVAGARRTERFCPSLAKVFAAPADLLMSPYWVHLRINAMSAVSSTSSSAVAYATQLATAATLRNSLNAIGAAVQNGDMTTANSLLTTFIQDNPQYGSTSSSSSTDPISQDFQTLATAVSGGQVSAAQSAWASVKSDLANDGVNLDTRAVTAQAIAQNRTTIDQEIMGDLFGDSSSGSTPSVTSFLGGDSDSSGSVGLPSSLLNDWVTYDQDANTTPVAPTPQNVVLDTTA